MYLKVGEERVRYRRVRGVPGEDGIVHGRGMCVGCSRAWTPGGAKEWVADGATILGSCYVMKVS